MLDKIDQKLLNYLYHNNRETYAAIAKKTNLTREQVSYRINKYVKDGIIRKFFSIFNYKSLGYHYHIHVFITFEDNESKDRFIKLQSKNILSWGFAYAKYDIYANYIFRDEKESNEYISTMMKDIKIRDLKIIRPMESTLYPLKFIRNNREEEINIIRGGHTIVLDNNEKKILSILEENSRARIVDIANQLNISGELALYKTRKLFKDKIVLGSRIQFNMSKLGYYFTLVLVNSSISEENKKKIVMHCKASQNINSLIIQLNNPNYIIQLFHQSGKELRKEIEELRGLLNNKVDIEVIPIGEEIPLINTLPFIE